MHFRICCCCNGEEKGKPVDGGGVPCPPIIPTIVVTEEPKPSQPIQLNRVTELSVEESSVQTIKRNESPPVIEVQESIESLTTVQQPSASVTQSTPTPTQRIPSDISVPVAQTIPPSVQAVSFNSSRSNSNLNFNTDIGGDSLTLNQVSPGCYLGTFKGGRFTIINNEFQTLDGAYSERDKELTMQCFSQMQCRLKEGMKQMENGMMQFMHPLFSQQLSPSTPVTINVDYMTRSGETSKMVFNYIEPGHFRSSYMGKEFSIVNGQLVTTDGDYSGLDEELILLNYKGALLGMEQGRLGMQQGMLGMQQGMLQSGFLGWNDGFMGMNTSQSSYNVLANGQETLKRMRSLNHGKRASILDGGLVAQPRQPVMVIEDISAKFKKPNLFDEVDGQELSNIPEPALRKTTFTPNAIIYEDPKTYEKLDKDELPYAKRLDEYIISMDESIEERNRYYFHAARPRRVTRKQLTPKEQLRIASPDRYSLFESESVKVHNEYRKMHGVPPLVNNEFLCQVAREWAEHLALKDAFYHRPKNEYGENLYYADGMSVCAKKAIKAWYDEIDLYDYNNPKFSKETGHFTQLVWKDTREVGTGVAQIGDKVWVCCNYHPPGNYTNKFNDEYIPRPVIKRVQRY